MRDSRGDIRNGCHKFIAGPPTLHAVQNWRHNSLQNQTIDTALLQWRELCLWRQMVLLSYELNLIIKCPNLCGITLCLRQQRPIAGLLACMQTHMQRRYADDSLSPSGSSHNRNRYHANAIGSMYPTAPREAKRFASRAAERAYDRLTKHTHPAGDSKIRWHHNIIQSMLLWIEWHKDGNEEEWESLQHSYTWISIEMSIIPNQTLLAI